jgi:hypothetical protein
MVGTLPRLHIPYKESPDAQQTLDNWLEMERWARRLGDQIPSGGGTSSGPRDVYWSIKNHSYDYIPTDFQWYPISFLTKWNFGDGDLYRAIVHNATLTDFVSEPVSGDAEYGRCSGVQVGKSGWYHFTFSLGLLAEYSYTTERANINTLMTLWASFFINDSMKNLTPDARVSGQTFLLDNDGFAWMSLTCILHLNAGDTLKPGVYPIDPYQPEDNIMGTWQHSFTGVLIAPG